MIRLIRWNYLIAVLFIGASSARPLPALTASDLFFTLSLIFWSFLGFKGAFTKRLLVNSFSLGFLLIMLGASLSIINSSYPLETAINTIKFFFIFIIFFVLGPIVFSKEEHFEGLLVAFSLSIVLSMIGVIAQHFLGTNLFGVGSAAGRFTGLSEHPNELGMHAGLTFFSSLLLLKSSSTTSYRVAILAILCSVAGIVTSASMTALVALLSGIAILSIREIYRGKLYVIVLGIALVVTAITASFFLVDVSDENFIINRVERQLGGDNQYDTLESRRLTNEIALKHISESPLIGVGSSASDAQMSDGSNVHNVFLRSFTEGGLFQGVGVLLVYLVTAAKVLKRSIAGRSRTRDEVILAALFVCIFIGAQLAPITIRRIAWIPFLIVLVPILSQYKSIVFTRRDGR